MTPEAVAAETGVIGRRDAFLLAGLGLAARVPLLVAFPAIHGGDSVARLARSDSLLLAYQLPLAQLLVFLARWIHSDPVWARLVFILIGVLVPIGLASAVARIAGGGAGRLAGALLALHPLFVYYSLVPYQEGLMILLLLGSAAASAGRRDGEASLLLALACLTRYEAWLAVPLFVLARRGSLARAVLLFGWAPLLWLAVWRGLSPAGTYVLDLDPDASRLSRLVFVWTKLREYSGDAMIGVAAAGVALAWRRRGDWGWPAAYLGLFLLTITVAGHEFPPGSGRVSERLVHVPAVALCALAGVSAGALAGSVTHVRLRPAALVLTGVFLIWQGRRWIRQSEVLVVEANADPSLTLASEVARLAARRLGPGERLAVLAPPVSAAAIDDYVSKVAMAGGDAVMARAIGTALADRSPDADRIAANLPRPAGTVVQDAATAALVAVFDDAGHAGKERPGPLMSRFVAGARAVSVYRLR